MGPIIAAIGSTIAGQGAAQAGGAGILNTLGSMGSGALNTMGTLSQIDGGSKVKETSPDNPFAPSYVTPGYLNYGASQPDTDKGKMLVQMMMNKMTKPKEYWQEIENQGLLNSY